MRSWKGGFSAGRALLALSGEHYDLVSVGVSTIGIPRQDRVELAPAIPGWEHVGLAHAVTAAFGVPVRVVTDVKAAATAEARWGALAGSDPAIYLNLGTGLAAAILVGGRVLDGAHGASGEIGYNVVAPGDAARGIAARPMLEHTVSGMALAAHGSRALGRTVTAEQVFEAANSDLELDAMVGTLVEELSSHLVNLVIAVDPDRVAVGGGMVKILGAHPRAARTRSQLQRALSPRARPGKLPVRCPAGRRPGPGGRGRRRQLGRRARVPTRES